MTRRVVELTALAVAVALRKPIRHASHTRTTTENLVVRCRLDDGTVGYGEGVPRPYVTGETIDSALALLKETDLEKQLSACGDLADALEMIESLRLAPVPGDQRGCQGNAARCAVELALLDAFCRAFDRPVYEVTRAVAPDLAELKTHVRYSGVITASDGLKLRLAAWKMRIYGFRQVKLKVGIEGQDDVQRLRSIRKRLGTKTDIRIDANEAWSLEHAVAQLKAFEPFGVTSAEQPLAHEDFASLCELRRATSIPIMLDESLCSRQDAEEAVRAGACDLFNLRLSKCGGYIPSLRLAQFARESGLGYQLGCQVGETAILSAAGRHFAASVRDIRYLEGSYDRHLLRESLATRDITFGYGGKAPRLEGPGLGIEVDPEALARVTSREERLIG